MNSIKTECPSCQSIYEFQEGLMTRPVSDGVEEVGCQCPICNYWTSAYFTTDKLEQKRANLQGVSRNPAIKPQERERIATKLRQEIQREHDQLQSRMRKLKS